jgi:hypothetical protein
MGWYDPTQKFRLLSSAQPIRTLPYVPADPSLIDLGRSLLVCDTRVARQESGDGQWLAIFVRDEEDCIVAGICGNTWGGCWQIRQLWVEKNLREQT